MPTATPEREESFSSILATGFLAIEVMFWLCVGRLFASEIERTVGESLIKERIQLWRQLKPL